MSSGFALEAEGGRWKRYPAYKDSGVEWMGVVPEGWETTKVKYTTYVKGRIGWQGLKSDEFIEVGPYLVTGTDFIGGLVNWGACYHVSKERYDEDPYIQLRENDLLITKDGTIGKTAIVEDLPDDACLNSGIFLTRPLSGDYITRFMYWLLNSGVFTKFIDYTKTGTTINHLYQNVFVEFVFPVPCIPEQHAIAAFLDRETGRIDALIAKKERQIELLQEKRTALISHAVTKGLDPDAPMKDSGVEWLGEIPVVWEVMKLRRICRVQQGLQIAQANRYAEPGHNRFEYITVKSIHANSPLTSKEYIEKPPQSVLCASDDILLARTGATGEVFSDQIGVFHNNFFKVIYDRKLVDKNYLIYYLSDIKIKKHLIMLAGTTTIPDLNHGDFLDVPFSYPTFDEQKNIVVFLDRETAHIANLTNKIHESIAKLREYRTALISAAVTGKIDVREESAP